MRFEILLLVVFCLVSLVSAQYDGGYGGRLNHVRNPLSRVGYRHNIFNRHRRGYPGEHRRRHRRYRGPLRRRTPVHRRGY